MDPRTLALAIAVLASCSGPRPHAAVTSVGPSPLAGHQRVVVDVRNEGPGHGEVEVEVTLRGASGRELRDTKTLELAEHERIELSVDIPAPPDVYVASVTSKYPD